MIHNGFVRSQPCSDKFTWRDVVKFICVDAQKPVAVLHVLSREIEKPAAQPCVREIHSVFADRYDFLILCGYGSNDLPRFVDTSGIEDIYMIRPFEKISNALSNDVGLITNRQKAVELHLLTREHISTPYRRTKCGSFAPKSFFDSVGMLPVD
jgi:hypothetical protein